MITFVYEHETLESSLSSVPENMKMANVYDSALHLLCTKAYELA